jgi:hypothetical protein
MPGTKERTVSGPDPKPVRRPRAPVRVTDPAASRQLLIAERACACCGWPASESHHILYRSHGGPDDPLNLAPLCRGCHQAEHGNSYRDRDGRYWTATDVRQAIAAYVRAKPGKLAFLAGRVAPESVDDFLTRVYGSG